MLGFVSLCELYWLTRLVSDGDELTLLTDSQGDNTQVLIDNATSDGLALPLTSPSLSETGVAILEQETDTGICENTLLHGETLLVVTAGYLEDVSLPFVAEGVADNFGTHTLVEEWTQLAFIFNFDQLLATSCWIGDVQLHVCCANYSCFLIVLRLQ